MSRPSLRRVATDRLVLEALGPEHRDLIMPLLEDPLVARTLSLTRRPPAPGGEPEALLAKAEHWERYGFGLWMMRDRLTGALVGRGGLQHTRVEDQNEVEMAWAVVSDRWGEGLATELALTCVELAFGRLRLAAVVAITVPDNLASRAVMTKAGMAYERDILHLGAPHVLYRLTR